MISSGEYRCIPHPHLPSSGVTGHGVKPNEALAAQLDAVESAMPIGVSGSGAGRQRLDDRSQRVGVAAGILCAEIDIAPAGRASTAEVIGFSTTARC